MIVIGIDPGAQTGIALLTPAGVVCRTVSWGADGAAVYAVLRPMVALARGEDGKGDVSAVVETPGPAYFPRRVNQRANYKIAMNVGECAAKAAALAGFLRGMGLAVTERRPLAGRTKRRLTVAEWRALFPAYQGRPPSGHARDAACLADHEYRVRKWLGGGRWT